MGVPLLSRLALCLAGPVPWRMGCLACRVPALVAGSLPWLAGQIVGWPFRWLSWAAACPLKPAPHGNSTSENFWRVGGSSWVKARRIGSSMGVGQKYQMPS